MCHSTHSTTRFGHIIFEHRSNALSESFGRVCPRGILTAISARCAAGPRGWQVIQLDSRNKRALIRLGMHATDGWMASCTENRPYTSPSLSATILSVYLGHQPAWLVIYVGRHHVTFIGLRSRAYLSSTYAHLSVRLLGVVKCVRLC